jgi:hypothetical protein
LKHLTLTKAILMATFFLLIIKSYFVRKEFSKLNGFSASSILFLLFSAIFLVFITEFDANHWIFLFGKRKSVKNIVLFFYLALTLHLIPSLANLKCKREKLKLLLNFTSIILILSSQLELISNLTILTITCIFNIIKKPKGIIA